MIDENFIENSLMDEKISQEKRALIELALNDAQRYRGSHAKTQTDN